MATLEERTGTGPAPDLDDETSATEHPSSRARLYRLLWRWHFYAGVITAPVFLVAAVTGALYVFMEELNPLIYPELMVAEPAVATAPRMLDELLADLKRELPQAKVIDVTEPVAPDRTAVFAVRIPEGPEGKEVQQTAFVDPGTGRLAGLLNEKESFFGIILQLHRRLFLGSFGRLLVELTASWGLVLLISGAYLWWPRGKGKAEAQGYGIWRPRLRGSLRTVLRDWHAVVGVYALTTAAFVLGTGLFFTQYFGPGFNWVAKQVSPPPPATPKSSAAAGRPRVTLAAAAEAAKSQLPGAGAVRVTLPKSPDDAIQVVRRDHSSPTLNAAAFVDAYSGQVVAVRGWDAAAPLQKVKMSVYPIHVGSIFGLTTKILAVLTCLALVLLTVTGVWMWWRRRPRGTWGLPPVDAATRVPAWLAGVIFLLAALLPAVGGSLIVILLGEFVLARFVRRGVPA